jgi:hypothetical protein
LLDFGGQDSIWLRMNNDTRKAVMSLGKRCIDSKRSIDDLLGGLIVLAAGGKLETQLLQLIAKTSPVEIPDGVTLPTLNEINA